MRRTDKIGTEASFHSLAEYMKYVDEYYDKQNMVRPVSKRRVFIASDDPKVSFFLNLIQLLIRCDENQFLGNNFISSPVGFNDP